MGLGSSHRPFLSNAANGFSGNLPSGASDGLSDALVTAETGNRHRLDEMADHVGIATNGRVGLEE